MMVNRSSAMLCITACEHGVERILHAERRARRGAYSNRQGLTKRLKSTKIERMNCLDIRIALIISIIHRMVG
ncbi:hypothetical protein [Paraburkholderia dipogonis]|uniref:hypothetical protein n=1 Tax=Paraburkholderia dipogonis TaxID=1211383 RepID=UPI0038B88281